MPQAEFADILGKRLADPSVSVKLKTIRVITLLMPDVAGFQEKVEAKAGQVLRDHVTYSCGALSTLGVAHLPPPPLQ